MSISNELQTSLNVFSSFLTPTCSSIATLLCESTRFQSLFAITLIPITGRSSTGANLQKSSTVFCHICIRYFFSKICNVRAVFTHMLDYTFRFIKNNLIICFEATKVFILNKTPAKHRDIFGHSSFRRGGIGSKESDLKLSDFRYYSRNEILDLIPFRSYSHFYFEKEREDLNYVHLIN